MRQSKQPTTQTEQDTAGRDPSRQALILLVRLLARRAARQAFEAREETDKIDDQED